MAVTNPSAGALTNEQERLLKSWLTEFESSWRSGALVERVELLPATPGSLRQAALIALVVADLRKRWQRGDAVGIDFYLGLFPELGTSETAPVELVRAEYALRQQAGDDVGLAELRRRFSRQLEQLHQSRAGQASSPGSLGSGAEGLVTPPYVPSARGEQPPGTVDKLDAEHGTEMLSRPKAAPAAEAIPEQFGRYRIVRRLGQGGMGSVYLAHDTQLDRQVALKVPHFGPADGPRVLERFFREARAAAQLRHPNICPIYDVGEINGTYYLTMAYIDGRSLADVVASGRPQAQAQAAAVVRKIALALEEAHRHGVIHRDLKPANVMLNKSGEPAVMDFGLAKRLPTPERPEEGDARLTRDGAILGTPAYMPPEQVQGDLEAMGPACDIYSLGVILYELLTGRLPFNGSVTSVLAQIMTKEPERPSALRSDLRPELESIVLKAMAKQPENRFSSMGDFAAALTEFLKGGAPKPVVAGATAGTMSRRPPNAEKTAAPQRKTVIEEPRARRKRESDDVPARGGRGWLFAVVGGGTLLLASVVIAVIMSKPGGKPTEDDRKVAKADDKKGAREEPAPIDSKKQEQPKSDNGTNKAKTDDTAKNTVKQKEPAKVEPPKRKSDYTNAPELNDVALPIAAAWDTRALRRYYSVGRASYEPETKTVSWLVEVKRGFINEIWGETKLDVELFDDDGIRFQRFEFDRGTSGLHYVPDSGVNKGDRVRITFTINDRDAKKTARVVLVDRDNPDAPPVEKVELLAKPKPIPADFAPEIQDAKVPFTAAWDTRALQRYFVVKSARYDIEMKKLVWMLVANRGFRNEIWGEAKIDVHFYDADDVRVYRFQHNRGASGLKYTPENGVAKDEAVRLTLELPNQSILKQTTRIVLVDLDNPDPPAKLVVAAKDPNPRAKKKDAAFENAKELKDLELPLQAAWDTRAFVTYFVVKKAEYDPETRQLKWTLEAKRGFANSVALDTKLTFQLQDEDGVDLYRNRIGFGPGGDIKLEFKPAGSVKRGEALHLIMRFPTRDDLQKVVKVVLVDGNKAPPKKK